MDSYLELQVEFREVKIEPRDVESAINAQYQHLLTGHQSFFDLVLTMKISNSS